MWRKLVQFTYQRKSRRPAPDRPYLPGGNDVAVYFVGALAQVWGEIEGNLDLWVEGIHQRGGEHLIQAHLPSNLDRELDYLSAALKAGLIPVDQREQAARLIERIHEIKGFRHTLIHGSLVEALDDGDRFVFEHSRVRGASRVRSRTCFKTAQMTRHYSKAFQLLRELNLFLTGGDLTQGRG